MSKEWDVWREYVLKEIKRLGISHDSLCEKIEKRDEKLHETLTHIHVQLNSLKVKIAVWGAIGGFVSLAVITLMEKFAL